MTERSSRHPRTPDGRYFVVRGRLWRTSDPRLGEEQHERFVQRLMAARRAVRDVQGEPLATASARAAVNEAKVALGERGPVWWKDGAPDYNRRMARVTPYRAWLTSSAGHSPHANSG